MVYLTGSVVVCDYMREEDRDAKEESHEHEYIKGPGTQTLVIRKKHVHKATQRAGRTFAGS
jgi:hypothetical protein